MENKLSILISSICMPLGVGTMLFALISEFSLLLLITGGLIMVIPLVLMKYPVKKSAVVEKKTYDWYKEKYPNSVQGDIITCCECENNSLDIRPLINEIFQSEVYCKKCRKTLYYLSR